MDVWDAMCRTIMCAGHRRGAMMATLRCDHPDIEAFIEAKREPGRLRMFNLSVLVTDAFMTAVRRTTPWPLVFNGSTFKTVPARDLWDRIMRATYAYAEPGVIFIDRINQQNNLCVLRDHSGDQSMRRAAAAALWRLPARLDQPGGAGPRSVQPSSAARHGPSWRKLVPRRRAHDGQCRRCLALPAAEQQAEAQSKRRIGLGVTGLADALILCRARYGSERAVALTEQWLAALRRARLSGLDRAGGGERPLPAVRRGEVPGRRQCHERWTPMCATPSPGTASATRC